MTIYSIIIPAKNEAEGLLSLLPRLINSIPNSEIIVIDDGSTDNTKQVCSQYSVRVISHPYSQGNGAAIKTGARAANGNILVFMDADGQHDPNAILELIKKLDEGFDLVVGARDGKSQANIGRSIANLFYNRLASYMTGQTIQDLTSGFRAVRANQFREFLYLLPNGFSYPTTVTMAFFRAGYPVAYVPITTSARIGKSHIHILKDGLRFLLIIFKIGTLYSPLKLFFPVALTHATLGLGYYAYSFVTEGRLSIATIFLLTAAITIFLIGLVSEQITQLMYKASEKEK